MGDAPDELSERTGLRHHLEAAIVAGRSSTPEVEVGDDVCATRDLCQSGTSPTRRKPNQPPDHAQIRHDTDSSSMCSRPTTRPLH